MDENRICPVCNARVPRDAPHGLCPSCLFAQVLGSSLLASPQPTPAGTILARPGPAASSGRLPGGDAPPVASPPSLP